MTLGTVKCPPYLLLRVAKRFQKSTTSLTYKSIQTTDKYFTKLVFQNLEIQKNFPAKKSWKNPTSEITQGS